MFCLSNFWILFFFDSAAFGTVKTNLKLPDNFPYFSVGANLCIKTQNFSLQILKLWYRPEMKAGSTFSNIVFCFRFHRPWTLENASCYSNLHKNSFRKFQGYTGLILVSKPLNADAARGSIFSSGSPIGLRALGLVFGLGFWVYQSTLGPWFAIRCWVPGLP